MNKPLRAPIMLSLIAGMVTGMGNGSVFGATLMLFLGRGKFEDWGGWGAQQFSPATYIGFPNWTMIVFGVAFVIILQIAVNRHLELESKV